MSREIERVAVAMEKVTALGPKAESVAAALETRAQAADEQLDKVLDVSVKLDQATQALSRLTSALSNFGPTGDGGS